MPKSANVSYGFMRRRASPLKREVTKRATVKAPCAMVNYTARCISNKGNLPYSSVRKVLELSILIEDFNTVDFNKRSFWPIDTLFSKEEDFYTKWSKQISEDLLASTDVFVKPELITACVIAAILHHNSDFYGVGKVPISETQTWYRKSKIGSVNFVNSVSMDHCASLAGMQRPDQLILGDYKLLKPGTSDWEHFSHLVRTRTMSAFSYDEFTEEVKPLTRKLKLNIDPDIFESAVAVRKAVLQDA